ncbi:MAG: MMPL family transporter [Phycisphaera sp.]|nr:MMPL family transporter [Phycisphaera sp.]
MFDFLFNLTRPRAVVIGVAALVLTGVAAWLTMTRLAVHTDPADLLSKDLPFRKTWLRYERQFPLNDQPLIFVLDADTPERADEAADTLESSLIDTAGFGTVYQPRGGAYLRRHALLYMTPQELQHLADGLSQSQALLARLAESPRSATLFDTLSDALDHDTKVAQLGQVMRRVSTAVEAQVDDRPYDMSWQTMLSDELDPGTQRILVAHPHLDYHKVMSGREALARARAVGAQLGYNTPGNPRMRITGKVALSHDEVQTVLGGMTIAGPLSLLLVAIVLYFALRSVRLMLATLVVLIIGLVLTTGLASLTVGHLNLISIAFGVLYVGLGVDFAIHYLLRYRACLERGARRREALEETFKQTGGSLALCSITTAIGFFAFAPTAFTGVSELGIIGGAGMIISLVVTLILLPVILILLPEHREVPPPRQAAKMIAAVLRLPTTHRAGVLIIAVALAIVAAALAPSVRFNPDPLDLRDPTTESVTTMRDLWNKSAAAHWSITALAHDADEVKLLSDRLSKVDGVDHAVSIFSLIPKDQDAKLAIIDDMNLLLGPSIAVGTKPADYKPTEADVAAWLASMQRLIDSAAAAQLRDASGPLVESSHALASVVRNRLESARKLEGPAQMALMTDLDHRILGTFPQTLRWLVDALTADRITLETLPDELRERWLSAAGSYRIEVMPATSLDDTTQLRRFVHAVQEVSPDATGAPVLHLESGDAIVNAFRTAMLYAIIGITLVILLQLRHVGHTLAVLLPLLLGGALTTAIMVLIDLPFNFANVIALPLLLGIGVDNGIHMVHRSRNTLPGHGNLLETVPARAVLYSTITTICSFGNLSLSPHPGTASMGLVLTIGIVVILACTLILLPALLNPREIGAAT